MIKKITILFSILFLFLSTATITHAQESQLLPKLVAGETVNLIDEMVETDVLMAGGQVKSQTTVMGDLLVAGGQLEIDGVIDQSLRAAGGDIMISGEINKNVTIAGGNIRILKDSVINGYTLIFAGQVDIDSTINGPVQIFAGNVNIGPNAQINGDLKVTAEQSFISDQALIAGKKDIQIIEKNYPETQKVQKSTMAEIYSAFKIFTFLSKLLILILLVRLLGKNIPSLTKPILEKFMTTLGWGFITLILTPFAIFILLITMIGSPLALIVTLLYGLSLYISGLITALALGQWLSKKKMFIKIKNQYILAFLGLLTISVICLIPVIGLLSKFIIITLGLGSLIQTFKKIL
jgi:hypothetical protein